MCGLQDRDSRSLNVQYKVVVLYCLFIHLLFNLNNQLANQINLMKTILADNTLKLLYDNQIFIKNNLKLNSRTVRKSTGRS